MSAYAFFGTGSDWFDPKVSVPLAPFVPPVLLPPLDPPQAASRPVTDRAAPDARAPLSMVRRPKPVAAAEGGTSRARDSASDCGRGMEVSEGSGPVWRGRKRIEDGRGRTEVRAGQ